MSFLTCVYQGSVSSYWFLFLFILNMLVLWLSHLENCYTVTYNTVFLLVLSVSHILGRLGGRSFLLL